VANPIARFVENVFTRINLVPQILGDGPWDIGRPRVKAVDYKRLHRNGLVRALEGVHIESGLLPVLVNAEVAHFLLHRGLTASASIFSYRRTGAIEGFAQKLEETISLNRPQTPLRLQGRAELASDRARLHGATHRG
jgi:hypothetical protein